MSLVQLIYASRSTKPLDLDTVEAILSKAGRHNSECNITGFLAFDSNHFLQVLEGDARVVNDLYRRILTDPRHTRATLLLYRRIDRREFPLWAMGDCDLNGLANSPLARHSALRSFQPFEMTGEAALSLLTELNQIRIQGGAPHGI